MTRNYNRSHARMAYCMLFFMNFALHLTTPIWVMIQSTNLAQFSSPSTQSLSHYRPVHHCLMAWRFSSVCLS